jgi:hypothetical protein
MQQHDQRNRSNMPGVSYLLFYFARLYSFYGAHLGIIYSAPINSILYAPDIIYLLLPSQDRCYIPLLYYYLFYILIVMQRYEPTDTNKRAYDRWIKYNGFSQGIPLLIEKQRNIRDLVSVGLVHFLKSYGI